jgi:uncharacterized protein YjbI with pentapeptide repeats
VTLNSQNERVCRVNQKLDIRGIKYYQEKVCLDLAAEYELEGNWYCVLHFPDDEKHTNTEFNQIIKDRLQRQDNNFRYVYFSDKVNLANYEFTQDADFREAIFIEDVNFTQTRFTQDADFRRVVFTKTAGFSEAVFTKAAGFSEAVFTQSANFNKTSFNQNANFDKSSFYQSADFRKATFAHHAYFSQAAFTQNADFSHSMFGQNADFSHAIFTQDAGFSGATFTKRADFSTVTFAQFAYFIAVTFIQYAVFRQVKISRYADFRQTRFIQDIDFGGAMFTQDAYFRQVAFTQDAVFRKAIFNQDADFSQAVFTQNADFSHAIFGKNADFNFVTFEESSQIFFQKAEFNYKVNFDLAIFNGYITFAGEGANTVFSHKDVWLSLQHARIEKPERISFYTVKLRPFWFVNIDSRKFIFTDIDWENADGNRKNVEKEIKAVKEYKITERPHRLLRIACRQLAVNSEENNRYEEASNFRQIAMETEWLEKSERYKAWFRWKLLHPRLKKKERPWWVKSFFRYLQLQRSVLNFIAKVSEPIARFFYWLPQYDFLLLAYRRLSNYGEGWRLAFVILFMIWLIPAALYMTPVCSFVRWEAKAETIEQFKQSESEKIIESLGTGEAMIYSLNVMALQKPEPKAADSLTKTIVGLETILAPIQAALLALAIRRKFMR